MDYVRDQFPTVANLLIDLRGHGKTGPVSQTKCTVEGAAEDVATVIEQRTNTGPLILVGHSLGGMVIEALMRLYPHRFDDRVAAVVLISSAAEPMSSEGTPRILDTKLGSSLFEAIKNDPQKADELRKEFKKLLAPALAATIFHQEGVHYDVVKFHASMISETPVETFIGYYDELRHHDETEGAKAMAGIPGYVLVGDKDEVTPLTQAQVVKKLWGDGQLEVINNVGHMLILEDPEACNRAIGVMIHKITGLAPQHPTTNQDPADGPKENDHTVVVGNGVVITGKRSKDSHNRDLRPGLDKPEDHDH